jgi:RimJ/RimL family protein N-acetyltransferase
MIPDLTNAPGASPRKPTVSDRGTLLMLLETERLVLRRFRSDDAPALAAYRSDPEVARYQSWDTPYPLVAAETMVAEVAGADLRAASWFQYAVALREDIDRLIGDVGVNRSEDGRQAQIGFTFAPAYQGHGYAAEAAGRVVDHLLRAEGLHRVYAECDARNTRSARLLERVGFRREGHLVRSTWSKGEWTDDLLYAVLAEERCPN